MIKLALGIIIGYLTTFFLLPLIIRFASDKQLFDIPDERKTHNHGVSSLGGIAIFIGLILSLLLIEDFTGNHSEFQYFIASFFIIFLLGVIDDIFILRAWKKFLGQLLVTTLLIFKGGLMITDFHGFLGIYQLSYEQGIAVTGFSMLLLINSFNLIDGVDGLAASLGFIACLFFGTFFLINNVIPFAVLSFSMCSVLLAFLMYNFPPAKIFMGDSGSTLIGLMTAILSVKFIQDPSIQVTFANGSVPVIAFGFLLIPLMDVLRVFTLRIYKRRSPLMPDRNHLHHLLQNKGLSHTEVTLTLVTAQFVFAMLTLFMQDFNINLILSIQFILYFSSAFILKQLVPARKKMHIVRDEMNDAIKTDSKVYPIYPVKEKVQTVTVEESEKKFLNT